MTWSTRARSALAGLLALAAGLGVGELLGAVFGPDSGPVLAVGAAAVRLSPRSTTEFAITQFGSNDKQALLLGILVVLALIGLGLGLLTLRRPLAGPVGFAVLAAVGAGAALSSPGAAIWDVLPSILAGVVAVLALRLLVVALPLPVEEPASGTPQSRGAAADRRSPRPAGRKGASRPAAIQPMARRSRPQPGAASARAARTDRTDPDRRNPGRLGTARRSPARSDTDREGVFARRRFVLMSGAVAGVAVVTTGAGGLLRRRFDVNQARSQLALPELAGKTSDATPSAAGFSDVPGLSPLITPNPAFYRIDTALAVPQISPADWSLRIHGLVDRELRLSMSDLTGRSDLIEADLTLACVSNEVGGPLAGNAHWTGVPMANLLAEAGVQAGADQVRTTSIDGWTCGTPTADCQQTPNAMLALTMNGEFLPVEHGFPVRMIVPGLYGYVSATKWLVDMELTTFGAASAYWVQRGWDAIAPIQTFSRIDTPTQGGAVQAGQSVVAGVAYSAVGISQVQVKIDGADWQPAKLSPATSVQTWRQWMLPWQAESGGHVLSVRAVDGQGRVQSGDERGPYPNASSGWHRVQLTVQ
ncbi:MAG: molybdopterin-dependent oxidoreductase [Geodermatophilaceae bacterium]